MTDGIAWMGLRSWVLGRWYSKNVEDEDRVVQIGQTNEIVLRRA